MIKTISFANFGTLNKPKKSGPDAEFEAGDFAALFGSPTITLAEMPVGTGAKKSLPADGTFESAPGTKSDTEAISISLTGQPDRASIVTKFSESSSSAETQPASEAPKSKAPITITAQNTLAAVFLSNSSNPPANIANKAGGLEAIDKQRSAQSNQRTKPFDARPVSRDISTDRSQTAGPNPERAMIGDSLTEDGKNTLIIDQGTQVRRAAIAASNSFGTDTGSAIRPAVSQPIITAGDNQRLFKEVLRIIRADDPLKSNINQKLFFGSEIFDERSVAASEDDHPWIDIPEDETDHRGDDLSHVWDEAVFQDPASNSKIERPAGQISLNHQPIRPVFEQIEPRILELAALAGRPNEKRTIRLRLNPQDLGSVEVTLEKSSTGRIDAHIRTETQDAKHILGENLANLRQSLENAGWNVGELEISYNSFSSNGDERREEHSQRFGSSEKQAGETTGPDGHLKTEGDRNERLVNLRA